jgi:hypothetical protein
MTNLKTKESTLKALQRAAKTPATPDALRRQRISFIMGSLNNESHVTRAQVKEILAKQEGEKTGS